MAITGNKFLGRATIRVDGQVWETAPGATLDVGGTKRNPVIVGKKVGFAEETAPGTLVCETALMTGMTLADLRNVTGATIIFEADTGQSFVISNAFITVPPTMKDGAGGNVSLDFAGDPAQEMAA
jgi:hypothetical protein